MNVNELRDDYIAKRLHNDYCQAQAVKAHAELKQAESAFADGMLEDEDIGKKKDGMEFRPVSKRAFYVNAETNEAWITWLDQQQVEVQDYTEEKVSKKRVSELAREVMEEKGDTAVPPDLYTEWMGVKVTGWGKADA